MNRKNLMNKIIIGVLAGCMMVSTGTLPFTQSTVKAASSSNSAITYQLQEPEATAERQGLTPFQQFEAQLDNLVSAGTITEDVKTKIVDYMKQKGDEIDTVKNMSETECQTYFTSISKYKSDLVSELVSNGVVSQDHVNAIEQALTLLAPANNQEQGAEHMPVPTPSDNSSNTN